MKLSTRATTAGAVIAVAVVAGALSYSHAAAVVSSHGESGFAAYAYPVTIDGLVYVAGMSLLSAARRSKPAPALAWVLMWAGIVATLTVNLLAGAGHGAVGAVIAAWPALALAGSFELLLKMVRDALADHDIAVDPMMVSARAAYPDTRAGSKAPSLASIRRTLAVSDTDARRVQAYLVG